MKKIALASLFFLSVMVVNAAITDKKLKCSSASSQQFSGGAAGSPSGVRYVFNIVAIASSENLVIDQSWIKNEYHDVIVYNKKNGGAVFSKNDTLVITVSTYTTGTFQLNNQQVTENAKQLAIPCEYKGDALLGYTIGGKRKYLIVKKIVALPRENRQ
ncbi:MAG: hypothetical protein IPP56_13330 [Bacteroidetes bacterium]|nr:hypothetical protein [Bacteroidota bacterium]MBK9672086.1 hypothetical protein [Bacteroidota bacterium]MBK9800641.1 hypothetical protein [Bacteroidota bacterium]MBP6412005.1 hypothetical protein [Bacteroidia bacterium]